MGIFCHAKLDYFYGAIYSTKFTTTLAGSAIFLKANVRANVRRGPNTMKICGRVWGYSSHCLLPAYVLLTVATTMYQYVYYSLVGLDTATACLRATTMVENQKNSQWNTWEEAIEL